MSLLSNNAPRRDSAVLLHSNVEEYKIRVQFHCPLDRLEAIACLSRKTVPLP
jgi:hypothetical protein